MTQPASNHHFFQPRQWVETTKIQCGKVWHQVKTWPSRLVILVQTIAQRILGLFRKQKPQNIPPNPVTSQPPQQVQTTNPNVEHPQTNPVVNPSISQTNPSQQTHTEQQPPNGVQPNNEPGIVDHIMQIPKDANCLINAIFEGLKRQYRDKIDGKGHTAQTLREKSATFLTRVLGESGFHDRARIIDSMKEALKSKSAKDYDKVILDLKKDLDELVKKINQGIILNEEYVTKGNIILIKMKKATKEKKKKAKQALITNEDLCQYIHQSRGNDLWCGEPQIWALSHEFGVRIVVQYKDQPEKPDTVFDLTNANTTPIIIQQESGNHYNLRV